MGLRRYQLPLASTTVPVRLSDVYGGAAGVVDAAADIPYRELTFIASAGALIGSPPDAPPTNSYTAYQDRVLADGAVSYWPLSETSGLTAADKTGARPGTISGGVTLGAAGITPGTTAMAFDATGTGRIDAAALPPLLPAFTQEVWGWFTALPNPKAVMLCRDYFSSIGPTTLALFNETVTLRFWGNQSDSVSVLVPGLGLSTWHHFVGTHDGTTMRIYVDGVLGNSVPSVPLPGDQAPTTTIGADPHSATECWRGRLQDVAVYPTALTPTQVANHYALRLAVAPTVLAGPPLLGVAAPFTLGPFDNGPLKLSHLYATGASGTLTILGVPY